MGSRTKIVQAARLRKLHSSWEAWWNAGIGTAGVRGFNSFAAGVYSLWRKTLFEAHMNGLQRFANTIPSHFLYCEFFRALCISIEALPDIFERNPSRQPVALYTSTKLWYLPPLPPQTYLTWSSYPHHRQRRSRRRRHWCPVPPWVQAALLWRTLGYAC